MRSKLEVPFNFLFELKTLERLVLKVVLLEYEERGT